MMDSDNYFSRLKDLRELDLARLHVSRVLVNGAGNVGGPVVSELARAGVGRITMVDNGVVEPANLSRGIFTAQDIGKPKAVAAARVVAAAAPGVEVTAIVGDVRVDVPEPFFSEHDAIVIATDSWSSRLFASRWAHALPGRVKVVVSGGLLGLSWEVVSSVPGSGAGCAQCPLGAEAANADAGTGCGIIGAPGAERIDPSSSFVGAMVASYVVMEVCSALGGAGPRFSGRMLSFDYDTARHGAFVITPDSGCEGHRRLVEGEDYITIYDGDFTVDRLRERVATVFGVMTSGVSLSVEREILRSRSCLGCGAQLEIMQPLIVARRQAGAACVSCGGTEFDVLATGALDVPGRTLRELGVAPGKAVVAHVNGKRMYVIRRQESC